LLDKKPAVPRQAREPYFIEYWYFNAKDRSMGTGVAIIEIPHFVRDDNSRFKEGALGLDGHSGMYDLVGQASVYLFALSS
jgi:hypothetical protein